MVKYVFLPDAIGVFEKFEKMSSGYPPKSFLITLLENQKNSFLGVNTTKFQLDAQTLLMAASNHPTVCILVTISALTVISHLQKLYDALVV